MRLFLSIFVGAFLPAGRSARLAPMRYDHDCHYHTFESFNAVFLSAMYRASSETLHPVSRIISMLMAHGPRQTIRFAADIYVAGDFE